MHYMCRVCTRVCSKDLLPSAICRLRHGQAGMTTLINRTYIVIKHLGSGTSGQVKLAFNLRSKKLVAIKAVRKSGSAMALACSGGGGRPHPCSSDGRELSAGASLRASALSRGWRSLAGSALRRSNSSTAANCNCECAVHS